MPRLHQSLLRRAHNISPLLPLLLRTCRTLSSARNELRWLREHVLETSGSRKEHSKESRALLLQLCQQRGRGVPLQYLLGSQPFGELDILCRPGVLIPRPETESYTCRLAELLHRDPKLNARKGLKILDLCTGSGCISLLLYALLAREFSNIRILGVDVSDSALRLAFDNLLHNITQGHLRKQALHDVSFTKADILSDAFHPGGRSGTGPTWDVVISNPPYISEEGFSRDTQRSVRNWEPKLALVPPSIDTGNAAHSPSEDIFYHRILVISAAAQIVLMEVGDTQQALRVALIAADMGVWNSVEIWRDWPDQDSEPGIEIDEAAVGLHRIRFRGTGHGRSVLCRK